MLGCVVAAGGDGTINAVAAAIVDADKALGVLPFGTMNHFAKDLNIPLDFDGAIETIVAGHVTRVDVGDVNGRIFVNNSSLGLYPRDHPRTRHGSNGSAGASGRRTPGPRSRCCAAIRFWTSA